VSREAWMPLATAQERCYISKWLSLEIL